MEASETDAVSEGGSAFAALLNAHGIGTAPTPIDLTAAQPPAFPDAPPQTNHAQPRSPKKRGSKKSRNDGEDAAAIAVADNSEEAADENSAEPTDAKARERTPVERYTVTIREMPTTERPRERLTHSGASALSATELLAIQLRIGTRERSAIGLAELLLSEFGGLRGVANASVEQLSRVKGIGPVKAVEIMAAVELGKRLSALSNEERPCIRSPQDVANLLMPEMRDLKKEHLKSLLMDSKNRVMKIITVSVGILDSSLVHPREVFKDAILASSASLIIAHNHPSGDPTPSPEDKRITQRLYEAGQLIGIDLLDHIVIGDNRWISLKERGVI